jgi:Phosphatidylinositol 3- and 4-kinase
MYDCLIAAYFTAGDRHMSNILVHKKTGEVIHIDFGVVFEQGMVRGILIVSPRLTSFQKPTVFTCAAIDCSGNCTLSPNKKRY